MREPVQKAAVTETGVVLTGTGVEALEARVVAAVRKPFYMIGGLLMILFVFLFGLSIFLNNLNQTVASSDRILRSVTSPKAQEQQKATVKAITDELNCDQQRNLQRALEALATRGLSTLTGVSVIKPPCTPESG